MRQSFLIRNQLQHDSEHVRLGYIFPFDGKSDPEESDDDNDGSDSNSPSLKRPLDATSRESVSPPHKKKVQDESVKHVPTLGEIHEEYTRIMNMCALNRPTYIPWIDDASKIDIYQLFKIKTLKVPFDETLEVQDLISIATPSPFGNLKSGLTEFDKKVRFAYEISDTDIELNSKAMERIIGPEILKDISNSLYGGVPISVELQKMNIYTRGGFFKPHQDTPKDIGTIGSLIVQIPLFKYVGGELNVYDDLHTNVGCLSKCNHVKMMAFYPEQLHEVTEVTNGDARITLSFTILAENPGLGGDLINIHDNLRNQMDKFCKEFVLPHMENTNQALGFTFTHRYSILDIKSNRIVKGIDSTFQRILSYNAKENGYSLSTLPIVVHHDQEEESADHQIVMTNEALFENNEVTKEQPISVMKKLPNQTIVFFGKTDHMKTISTDEGNGEFTGNETNSTHINNFYYSCASILHKESTTTEDTTQMK